MAIKALLFRCFDPRLDAAAKEFLKGKGLGDKECAILTKPGDCLCFAVGIVDHQLTSVIGDLQTAIHLGVKKFYVSAHTSCKAYGICWNGSKILSPADDRNIHLEHLRAAIFLLRARFHGQAEFLPVLFTIHPDGSVSFEELAE